jgi:transcriptional regulator with XRE-family HTH domain
MTRADRLRELLALLKESRESQGLSLSEVGERSGIGKANLCRLENDGNPNPRLDTLFRYAEAIGKSLVIRIEDAACRK